ncbi:MAG: CTP synthase [Chloroflexi bacterium]|nr:CTP synthase [Chloroflexota bacterium]
MAKHIFVSGGVVSGIGKGITAASIGRLLKGRGIRVSVIKLDPYINVDPGTMNPYQHGEVFVTDDGAETDMDLGHYERFIDVNLSRVSSVTTGQVYSAVIARERHGDFLGGTIQVIPHITNEIKDRIGRAGRQSGAEVVIVEVGGTVGDIECLPFLEAVRQMHLDLGRENTFYIHVTLLPYIAASDELKTKPTQHSVKELRSIGIQPDAIVCRSDQPVPPELIDKIALFCDVDRRAVVPLHTVSSIYQVPLVFEDAEFGNYVVERLHLAAEEPDLDEWREMVGRIQGSSETVRVGLVGKYVELRDAYISVREALYHAGWAHHRKVEIEWIDSQALEAEGGEALLEGLQGILVPGGFGGRGIEGMIKAAQFARERSVPYLGLCLGMQIMVIEFARHVLGLEDANSTEFSMFSPHPVIDLLPEQRDLPDKGGTMRLGLYPCQLQPGTRAIEAYGEHILFERHRHRYEFNNEYRLAFERAGMRLSGLSPDGRLVEIAEVEGHPWMLGSQFHPEFRSRPHRPHPLFLGFVGACLDPAPAIGSETRASS